MKPHPVQVAEGRFNFTLADVIARVSFWNLHDGQSWLNPFPRERSNHPLLFDRTGRPKPAFSDATPLPPGQD